MPTILLDIVKQSDNFNPAELKILQSMFTGNELYCKIVELFDDVFEKDCRDILRKRGIR